MSTLNSILNTSSSNQHRLDSAYKTTLIYMGILMACVMLLGVAHWFFSDVRIGRVYWFHLDKERNVPTWFSGLVFFLLGCAALVAFYWERHLNLQHPEKPLFRLPILWLGIGLAGFYMSLDEITILHENLFWRETRLASAEIGETLKFFTQWQLLFAPAILMVLAYFIVFFSNRYRTSKRARNSAFTGIACWVIALSLEGFRETFILWGASQYELPMIVEEMLETIGAIFLLGAIVLYILSLVFSPPTRGSKLPDFLTQKVLITLSVVLIALSLSAGIIYLSAKKQVKANSPSPFLYKKAIRE